ncbi:similar to Saccharomyces cerevisiae YNL323W LEM3 Membrane protein of the plasma membrane and ER, interacts specifically in vivo with the phospholipid translocase (flippase) Dnf1p [Maudiozyma saulgeensis]|uniref:Similar to Saccharomyces cerevisiae YNL323W LEM3 Membrane protein of the plasma membrane and ER, interacts specifically in vivo with the phospholipid translocase (Flippase) Dnf1p n=1 Tax=Maudiozyma saulgeensis TaxID=1789683 RepID=A0A1X7R9U2_9SACH|nr:similar to Saccharomyces cerevisiae YNL323W LEM3 Membrane protein of the plasma membrane and ER, interacts specifically in vivo with the phospholipid translocase (flippase) Dnf1p [Kazachstania saulgeensis]
MVNLKLGQVDVFHRNKESNANQIPAEEEDVDASEFEEYEPLPKKVSNRRPREDKFTQQRLTAINPVLTPRTVLPVYVLVAAVFVIVGGCLLAESAKVDQIKMYYQDCRTQAGTDSFTNMNSSHYEYFFHKNKTFNVAPQWRFVDDTTDDFEERGTCQLRFTIPTDMAHTVYVNYMIEKFAANHRRYVLSFSEEQLNGEAASYDVVHERSGINCKPLARNSEGKLYYPCGLIANAMFNDTFPFELTNVDDSSKNYPLTNEGINWKSDGIRFKKTKYNYTEIAPPPYWEKSYPDGYNETNVPNVHTWEEFQNWMRPGAFDKSTKLIRRNQNDTLPAGTYQIDIGLHWPVNNYNGKKAVFITHGSTIGGKNEFLGEIYLIGGCICFAMALVLLGTWLMTGRKIADPNALSWNRRT